MSNHPINNIPTIDLGRFLDSHGETRREIAAKVDKICREIGFLIIENHRIDEELIRNTWEVAGRFFQYNQTEKHKVKPADPGSPRGYTPIEGETLSRTIGEETPPDLKETFSSGPISPPQGQSQSENFDFFYGSNIWPLEPVEFKETWIAYYKAMEVLGANIMTMLAAALEVDDNFFAKYHTHHISALRCQYYPGSPNIKIAGQLRAGAHTDYGSVTILKADPKVAGLEILAADGSWIKAPLVKSGFIINIGDMLSRWTNDRWVSTMHRVVEPEGIGAARQSIAYFMNPNYDVQIETISTCISAKNPAKYDTILAGEYLMKKFNQSI